MAVKDKGGVHTEWAIHKFSDRAAYRKWEPYEVSTFGKNVLLNEGITRLQNLLIAGGGTAYNQANAYLGVGDSTASSGVATSTGLLSTTGNTLYVQCSTAYPQILLQTTTWRAVFSSAQANFNWREFTISNANGSSGENLNRRVSNQGTKAAGQTWTLDIAMTFS